MGVLSDMFGDKPGGNEVRGKAPEHLAAGEFVYDESDVLEGYRLFRRRYVARQTALRLILAVLALASSLLMLFTDGLKPVPVFCTALCVVVTAWFIKTPIDNKRKTAKSVSELVGETYAVEFTTATLKIALITDTSRNVEDELAGDYDQELPATLIHLDQYIVDILDTDKIYVIVVAKRYVFVIPKAAFDDETNARIRERLSDIMETRYKSL
jgi:hypothetical protein